MRGDELFAEMAARPPYSKMHPAVAVFFKDYLANEKAAPFGGGHVLSTHFPPWPSRAFDNLAEHFYDVGDATRRRLYSVTLAVTNRCPYNCWHCYNAGRSQTDMPLGLLMDLIRELQEMGAVSVTLTGGEPLLRGDLLEIVGTFDDRSFLKLNTTGAGLTPERARSLREAGLFGFGVSLDSADEEEHDRLRGRKGAFQTALNALRMASEAGLYPYAIAVASHEFLERKRFMDFLRFASDAGAREVHILEPIPAGKLAGKTEVLLGASDRKKIIDYQGEVARDEGLPIVSSFLYLESADAFGCGAGLTHIYIDGCGEVSPCNLVPISFGNIMSEPLSGILEKMGGYFCKPRTVCVGRTLNPHIAGDRFPTPPEESIAICEKHLPKDHPIPRFFQIRSQARERVGRDDLQSAYNRVHGDYNEFWLKEAGGPIVDLIDRIDFANMAQVFEAGCGTGFATALLAERAREGAEIIAADLSEGMISEAKKRFESRDGRKIRFIAGDALEAMKASGSFDLVFSSWVLGYIPLNPFFRAAAGALRPGGRLAFVVHKENSPHIPLQIFGEIVARDPSVLQKLVAFDFPHNTDHIWREIESAGLAMDSLWEGQIDFVYSTPEEVLEHLLKSGAGTAYYDAVDPARRAALENEFMKILAERNGTGHEFHVVHDYISCIARRKSSI